MMQPGGTEKWRPGGAKTTELGRGASVGRYLVLGLLGKGGMGEVYAAYDPELDRKIALKLLRTQTGAGADPEGRARLLREAQAIARLSDPNVVVMYDVGMFDERVFLAMEFVDGHTLGYWLHVQPRRWQEVLKVFLRAGQGLASAHKAGIVHRDFKPENVMIAETGDVRVMDFGLARSISADGAGADPARRPGPTPTGSLALGSAPRKSESLRASLGLGPVTEGGGGAVDRSTSVVGSPNGVIAASESSEAVVAADRSRDWSAGSTDTRDLSRATALPTESPAPLDSPLTITGAMMGTPAYMAPEQFRGEPVDDRADQFAFCVALYEALYGERPFKGKSINELTAAVLAGRVREAPSHARVPGWLRKVVVRGLKVNRDERHPSMAALLKELRRDPARTQRRWAAAGGVTMLVALLGVGLVRAERKQRMRCLGAEAKLTGIWEPPKGKGALSPRKEVIKKTFLATGKRYAADSFNVVVSALDRYVGEWTKMHRDSCEATNVRGEQSAEVLDLRTSCLNDRLVELRALTNVFAEANGEVVEKSVQAAQSLRQIEQCADIAALKAVVKPPDDPAVRKAVADVRARLADVKALTNAGKYKKASDALAPVLDSARKTEYKPLIAESLVHLAAIQNLSGRVSDAERAYEDAVWLAEASRHDEVLAQATSELVWSVGYFQGRYADGERWSRHSAAVLRRLGPGHEVLAAWRANNLGLMYEKQGKLDAALATHLEALSLKKRALGENHFDVGISCINVALALFRLGRVDEAMKENARALDILRNTLGAEHPNVAIALFNAAEFLNARGRFPEALEIADQARLILEREYDRNHPLVAYPLTIIGTSLVDSGSAAKATPFLERALTIREERDPEADLLGDTRFALARSLWDSHRERRRALSLAEKARTDFRGNPGTKDRELRVAGWIASRSVANGELVAR